MRQFGAAAFQIAGPGLEAALELLQPGAQALLLGGKGLGPLALLGKLAFQGLQAPLELLAHRPGFLQAGIGLDQLLLEGLADVIPAAQFPLRLFDLLLEHAHPGLPDEAAVPRGSRTGQPALDQPSNGHAEDQRVKHERDGIGSRHGFLLVLGGTPARFPRRPGQAKES